ncbi:MAG: hypothetical protein DCC43_00100 [Candidatus Brocadia sp.]|jgi:Flagellar basal body-associated protein|uniref:Flagellar protein FliL n=1 Tax=Candidatus Brocadia fulgida TaxID=380242 RepID=A0A0M2UUW8_9BACT|nr:MAG: flagellar basal body-associated protein FliL [Candidatus Brocadia fulgida]MCC6324916.1 flagellar basal body-associated FliL family protein [Candidatus Brocadia sp.]MCE7911252.1 hypothetical protein [Candidatus Brocadia sp. AMX3]MBV6517556.1 hypothetical protein [Candidatus Brocadia fulgida]MDG5996195.1 flagellar basal body-associated FliL family protein [Candidatus Brocadia sp.]
MENKEDKNKGVEISEVPDPSIKQRKTNKSLMLMGSVVLISVGCAFLFVSKVYPSLSGNVQIDVPDQEKILNEDGEEKHAEKDVEVEVVPKSASKKKEEKGKGQQDSIEEESTMVPFEPVIVNLSGSGGRRYLKTVVNLEAKDGETKHKIEAKMVQIKDRLISILSSKTLEDIEGLEGQESLRREIKDAADMVVKAEDGILQVYFSEFVIQ